MARHKDHHTRVDQLHADLRVVRHATRKQAGAPPAGPLFTVEFDGTVRDRKGGVVFEPPPKPAA